MLSQTSRDRTFRYSGLTITVKKGVFHPGFFFSSLLLIQNLESKTLKQKKVLELGCGAGLLAVYAASRGADVTASDINPDAVENTAWNADQNQVYVRTIQSDLFNKIPDLDFDFIMVNPPYYRKNPSTNSERAWYAGDAFQYFHDFFIQLNSQLRPNTQVYMILSEDCEIGVIRQIAKDNQFAMMEVKRHWKWWEWNFIFSMERVVENS